ncbi:MAG: hypothetical protein AAGF30_05070 [Pseudomonadota bacterium]
MRLTRTMAAPRRRPLVVVIEGTLEVTRSDGEARVSRPGDLLYVADTEGVGHRSCALWPGGFHSVFVALDDDLVTDRLSPLDPNEDGPVLTRCTSEENRSRFSEVPMRYGYGGPSGTITADIPVSG